MTIQQSPPTIVATQSTVNFGCSHNNQDMNVMLWYQQTSSGRMNLIGSSYGNSIALATEFEGRFEVVRKNLQTGSLVLHNSTVLDSAVYFCAAREHSDVVGRLLHTETPPSWSSFMLAETGTRAAKPKL